MHITLIGMSNIGKSHWSHHLANTAGYERVGCDDLVEARLGSELTKHGFRGIHDVAKWMGQPYDTQYAETSRIYKEHEQATMLDVIARLRSSTTPLVIDTTGSVIYTGDAILQELRKLSQVVYFEASPDHVTQLFERYIAHPKPVIWGDSYQPNTGETSADTLRRCYPALLKDRAARYQAIAHVSVPFAEHKAVSATWKGLVEG